MRALPLPKISSNVIVKAMVPRFYEQLFQADIDALRVVGACGTVRAILYKELGASTLETIFEQIKPQQVRGKLDHISFPHQNNLHQRGTSMQVVQNTIYVGYGEWSTLILSIL
jgi:hypothetical protein